MQTLLALVAKLEAKAKELAGLEGELQRLQKGGGA